MSTENKALVRRWFEEVWNQGNASAIEEMLATEGIVHGLGPDSRGPAGFKPFHAAYRTAFPDVTITIEEIIGEGDIVAVRWNATGTYRGEGLGAAAKGKAVRFGGMAFARVEGGKLVEGWNTFDQLGMFQQLGAISPPAAI